MSSLTPAAAPALVARTAGADRPSYLVVTATGRFEWVEKPTAATSFSSMREAMRMAMRLPANLRAFGLPRAAELALQ